MANLWTLALFAALLTIVSAEKDEKADSLNATAQGEFLVSSLLYLPAG